MSEPLPLIETLDLTETDIAPLLRSLDAPEPTQEEPTQ